MNDDQSLENQINRTLDDTIENLSPEVRRRLNQIRIEATEVIRKPLPFWKTASAFSFLIAMTMGWLFWPAQTEMPITPFAEVLVEDPEMLEELDFIYWMAEEGEVAML